MYQPTVSGAHHSTVASLPTIQSQATRTGGGGDKRRSRLRVRSNAGTTPAGQTSVPLEWEQTGVEFRRRPDQTQTTTLLVIRGDANPRGEPVGPDEQPDLNLPCIPIDPSTLQTFYEYMTRVDRNLPVQTAKDIEALRITPKPTLYVSGNDEPNVRGPVLSTREIEKIQINFENVDSATNFLGELDKLSAAIHADLGLKHVSVTKPLAAASPDLRRKPSVALASVAGPPSSRMTPATTTGWERNTLRSERKAGQHPLAFRTPRSAMLR